MWALKKSKRGSPRQSYLPLRGLEGGKKREGAALQVLDGVEEVGGGRGNQRVSCDGESQVFSFFNRTHMLTCSISFLCPVLHVACGWSRVDTQRHCLKGLGWLDLPYPDWQTGVCVCL